MDTTSCRGIQLITGKKLSYFKFYIYVCIWGHYHLQLKSDHELQTGSVPRQND